MQVLVVVPIVLILAFLLGGLFRKMGFPSVVGEILAGIVLGIPVLEQLLFYDATSLVVVDFLADLGIVFLLFLAGLEIDIAKIKETSRDSILISLSSALVPFCLGFAFIRFFFPEFGFFTALVFGGAMMVTSEGTKVKVLMDLNSLNTHLGAVMLSAGAIDDIFEVLFLSIVMVMAHGGGLGELVKFPLELLAFAAVVFVAFKVVTKVLPYVEKNGGKDETELFSIVVIFILVLAAISEVLQMGYLIGAIIGGFLLQLSMKGISRAHRREMIRTTKLITLGFIVPFFFANVGINLDLGAFSSNISLIAATVAMACAGKILGTILVKPFSSLSLKQLYYTGWAMNSRGAAELVIALIAKQYGLIPPEVFSALVAMSLITTFTFPPILARGIRRNRGLMRVTARHKQHLHEQR